MTLKLERHKNIAWLWMNQPQTHNAFDASLIEDLKTALMQLDRDDDIRAVVLAGRGKSFSAGANLHWMREQGTANISENRNDAQKLGEMLLRLYQMNKPVVARVHGPAIGGGMGLAAACSICIASSSAVFATSEVRLGLAPSVISPYVLRAIGARQAQRYFLTAERISAQRAYEIGLVHDVVDDTRLDERLSEVLDAVLRGGPAALQASMDLIRDIAGVMPSHTVTKDTAERIAHLRASDEAREGVSAFFEKRPAHWCTNLNQAEKK